MKDFVNADERAGARAKRRGALLAAVFTCALAAVPFTGIAKSLQDVPVNAPKYVKSAKVPGVELRYLDFRWDAEAFATIEKGGAHPVGRRSWVLARLVLWERALKWKGKWIPVGPSLLVLNPAKGAAGPTFELREVDMREIFIDMNVVAEPPPGETYQTAPAVFKKVDRTAPLLEVSLRDRSAALDVVVHYGDREAVVTLDK